LRRILSREVGRTGSFEDPVNVGRRLRVHVDRSNM
jgi:hypothetical protein